MLSYQKKIMKPKHVVQAQMEQTQEIQIRKEAAIESKSELKSNFFFLHKPQAQQAFDIMQKYGDSTFEYAIKNG